MFITLTPGVNVIKLRVSVLRKTELQKIERPQSKIRNYGEKYGITEKLFILWKYGVLKHWKIQKMEKISILRNLQKFYNIKILQKYEENFRNTEIRDHGVI